ncbi:MAG: hypothetical protein HZB39_18630 [Planctomycetes bacterium]|nr:hypothetical protein [Planctomycetota bacterium]
MTDDEYQRLESLRLVTFSCHEAALRELKPLLSVRREVKRHHLFEFFLREPLRQSQRSPNTQNRSCYVPFIDREVAARGYILDLPPSETDLAGFLSTLAANVSGTGPVALPLVSAAATEECRAATELSDLGSIEKRPGYNAVSNAWKDGNLGYIYKRLETAKKFRDGFASVLKNRELTPLHRAAFANVFGPLGLHLLYPKAPGELLHVVVSIATKSRFFGVLALIMDLAPSSVATKREAETHRKSLIACCGAALLRISHKFFVPAMVLNYQGQLEAQVDASFAHRGSGAVTRAVTRAVKRACDEAACVSHASAPLSGFQDGAQDVQDALQQNHRLEETLARVWQERLEVLSSRSVKKESLVRIREGLMFKRMKVASPGMLKTVHDAIRAANSVRGRKLDTDPIPCVLVVGSAGSGKENIAKLILVLASGFANANVTVQNMAGVRDTDAIQQEIWRSMAPGQYGFLWDELNSLSMDVQGALLRFLEQGEVQGKPVPVGSRLLVVGIVNEDPGQLTLRDVRERTRDTVVFGEMLGSLLYEHFKTKSRMRDDLYFRIRRCGEVRILDLDDRREDIPSILRHLYSRAGGSEANQRVFFTYAALSALTNPEIRWKGNVRQLELVAREVRTEVDQKERLSGGSDPFVIVDEWMVRRSIIRARVVDR